MLLKILDKRMLSGELLYFADDLWVSLDRRQDSGFGCERKNNKKEV
jgi:hypothetical protein